MTLLQIIFEVGHRLHVTVTRLTKISFHQPGWQAVTIANFCQTRPDNSHNHHIWVGVTSDPFFRQPRQTPNFVLSEGPVMRDWQIDRNCTVYLNEYALTTNVSTSQYICMSELFT